MDVARYRVAYPMAVIYMRIRERRLFSGGSSLVVAGLLAGLVVAGAVFPVVAISGLAAKAAADTFDNLPSELALPQSPQETYVYASDRKTLITTLYDENRRDVNLADVAPVMQQAIIAAEDTRFYEHNGVDIKGVIRALVMNGEKGAPAQGASTLTMQYVRQAIAYSPNATPQEVVEATEETSARKIREMKLAVALEKKLSKQEILERYLNIAPFGHGAYGIYAASEVYFGKLPNDLTLPEASLLAGLVKAPSQYDPTTDSGRTASTKRRDNYVLANMVELRYITQEQAAAAKKAPLKILGRPTPNGCTAVLDNNWGFFCDYVQRWWLSQPAFGASAYERENRLKGGGYTIYTSMDVGMQAAARRNIEAQLKTGAWRALMLAGVEPGTGRIQFLATNRRYSNDQTHNGPRTDGKTWAKSNYPNTTNPLITGSDDITGYQAGSSFKVFTMVAALEHGYPLDYTINTVSPYKSHFIVDGPSACPGTSYYCPVNATASWMNGPRNMWTGFGRSVNTYFVPLEERVGAQNAVAVAKRLGIQFRAHGPDAQHPGDWEFANKPELTPGWGAFTLGVSATTPLDLVNAYATLAADGKYCEPLPVTEIRDFTGNKVDAGDPRCRQEVDPNVARGAVDAARCPVNDQSAYGRCDGATERDGRSVVGKPVAGKTGTTDGDKTAALVAMTRQVAVAGIEADPDSPSEPPGKMSHAVVNTAVLRTLHDAMVGKPAINFTPPTKEVAFGKRVSIPYVTCMAPVRATYRLKSSGFEVATSPQTADSRCPAGTVAGTDPYGSAPAGSTIVLILSRGTAPSAGPPSQPAGPDNPGGGGHGGGQGTPIVPIPSPTCRLGYCPPA